MSSGAVDYSELVELGFRCGLETHQQLATSGKLFRRGPATIGNDEPDSGPPGHMRPMPSESGEYDGTALMEFETRKRVHYLLDDDGVCTCETDGTHPLSADPETVESAIEIAMMFGMSIVDEIHFTRKHYIDGSMPTGFQRTAVVGVNGSIPFLDRTLGFHRLSLEEDACRMVDDVGRHVLYRTDRLSMPLVESATKPEFHTPAEAAAGAALIGEVMRSTRRVRRGIGSVRQDVNVSIRGGTRVEIKGVPRIGMIERLCTVEGYRQKALLDIRSALSDAGLERDSFAASPRFLDGMEIEAAGIADLAPGETAAVQILPGFAVFLDRPVQPGTTFLDEIDGRVRVIACLESRPCVSKASEALRASLGASPEDAVLLFHGPREDLAASAREIVIRVCEAFDGVPPETRQALPGGNTAFKRMLSGPDRTYPDTDLPPEAVSDELRAGIAARLKPRPWERRAAYRSMGVSDQLAGRLINWETADLFDRVRPEVGWPPATLAWLLTDRLRGSRRDGADWAALGEERVGSILIECFEKGVSAKGAARVMDAVASDPGFTVQEAISRAR